MVFYYNNIIYLKVKGSNKSLLIQEGLLTNLKKVQSNNNTIQLACNKIISILSS